MSLDAAFASSIAASSNISSAGRNDPNVPFAYTADTSERAIEYERQEECILDGLLARLVSIETRDQLVS